MSKFIFFRPHKMPWYKNTVMGILRSETFPAKYEPLFDYIVDDEKDVYFSTKFLSGDKWSNFFRCIPDLLELVVWCLLNRIALKKIKIIVSKSKLDKKDILFMFHYGNGTHVNTEKAKDGKEVLDGMSGIKAMKVVHLTHYEYNTSIGLNNLQILRPDVFVCENNLARNSDFFAKYFSPILSVRFLTLPYIVGKRFSNKTPFKERKNLIVATGSIASPICDVNFISHYGSGWLQPFRNTIAENASRYPNVIDSLISYAGQENEGKNKATHLLLKIWKALKYNHPQSSYYALDIVEIYNSYKMFIVTEEICDLPAIGSVEGMGCGSVLFARDLQMYRDIGMIPMLHFVAFDGTIENLVEKVKYYQTNLEELETIAKNGFEFAKTHLNQSVVCEQLRQSLAEL